MNLTEFHFIRPYWLLSILPFIAVFYLLLKNKLSQGSWSNVCDPELLPFILQEKPVKHSRLALFSGGLSALIIIFALAGPTWERLPSPVFRNDAALVIALDLSNSMNANDIKPSRLERARFKIADILKQRKDGQTALLVYAGDAFTVTPLTTDTETIASQLSALTTEIMPAQGNNTPLALSSAIKLLKQTGLQSGEILLITDDVDLERSTPQVEALAGYRLSILGVGTAEGAPIKLAGGGFLKDAQGNIVLPKLNSTELSKLATAGKGLYKTISNDNSDIEAILSQLQIPTKNSESAVDDLFIDQWNEKGPWLLLLVLPLAALQFRKGLLSFALICLLPFPKTSYALEWNDLWKTPNQQAQQDFSQKNYQQAADKFQNSQWKASAQYKAGQYEQAATTLKDEQSSSGLYNLGNALAKSGKLPEAVEAYEKSLQIDPENEDTKHNKNLVEKELEKQQKDKKQNDSKDSEDKKPQQDGDSKQSDKKKESKQNSNSEQKQQEENSDQSEEKSKSDESKEAENQQQQDKQKQEDKKKESKTNDFKNAKEQDKAKAEKASKYNEADQASEQWLKRIPDDPAGLLKRKFKYQYGQRGQKNDNNQAW